LRLNYLSLTNFRNYTRLELRLPGRLTLVRGANAQGKTNLLEAIHLLATGRSPRALAERELINWLALESPLPYARLAGEIGEGAEAEKLELVLESVASPVAGNGPIVRKQVRVNGAPKRALDLVGRLRVVLFLPEDISLVAGVPAQRRRYLDIALCQISPAYCRALSEYNRVISQRNALLKRLREHGGDARQLAFWNARAAEQGGQIIYKRVQAIAMLHDIAARRHLDLTRGEQLRLAYLPGASLEPEGTLRNGLADASQAANRVLAGGPRLRDRLSSYLAMTPEVVADRFLAALQAAQEREIAAGTSLLGPHRDDMSFAVDGQDLRTFGSRGQQRTAALALKLAEMEMMQKETGSSPLLLLDDVMSELDEQRRETVLAALDTVAQAVVTTTDLSDFGPALLRETCNLQLTAGVLAPMLVE
jgi:DNA replication and repair protein RecF